MVNKNFYSRKFIVFVLTFLISFILCSCSYGINNKELSKKIEKAVDTYAEDNKFNGNIFVAKGGEILINKSYGYADFDNKVKVNSETRFLIGSLTKQFTAVAIMQLNEKGLLNVDDKLEKYAPGFPSSDKITIHHLLTHTSGLPREIQVDYSLIRPGEATEAIKTIPSMSEILEKKGTVEFPKLAEPGKYFNYSNAGYIMLGYIIEKVSGVSYDEYLQKNIFSPLGMKNSGFGYDRRNDNKLALGYDTTMNCLTKEPFIAMSAWPHAAAALYSTTEDLYKWDRALYTDKLVSEKSLEQIFIPNKNNYGYGWYIKSTDKKEYQHNGMMLGFGASITRRVGNNICIIALSNIENFDGASSTLEGKIIDVINADDTVK